MSFADELNKNYITPEKKENRQLEVVEEDVQRYINTIKQLCISVSATSHSIEGYLEPFTDDNEYLYVSENRKKDWIFQMKQLSGPYSKRFIEEKNAYFSRYGNMITEAVIRKSRSLGFKTFVFRIDSIPVSLFSSVSVVYFSASW